MTEKIPFSSISKIEMHINKGKRSMAQIKSDTGADYIINGGLYDMAKFKPVCHLKSDGIMYARDDYKYWGLGWNNPLDMALVSDYAAYANYICCVALLRGGSKEPLKYGSDLAGKRGRSGIGKDAVNLYLYCTKDGTSQAGTPEMVQNEMRNLGALDAIMLDGGGSSQCDFAGEKITSARIVHNYILVYLKKETGGKKLKIAIDAGHGKETAGKRSPDGLLREYEFNRDVAQRLKGHLTRHGIDVMLTAPNDTDVSLNTRCTLSNNAKCDYFVSIHANAYGETWNTAKGWEIYILSKGGQAEKLARDIRTASVPQLGLVDRGVKCEQFAVLKNTAMPAVLIEHGFYTNIDECEKLKTAEFREACAVADCKGILKHLGVKYIEVAATAPWYAQSQEWVKANGISDGTRPTDVVTRAEVWEMLRKMEAMK